MIRFEIKIAYYFACVIADKQKKRLFLKSLFYHGLESFSLFISSAN